MQLYTSRTFCCALSLMIFFSQTLLLGLLPPLYEDIAEIKAILESPQLGQYLESGESIQEIKKHEKGYLIKTNHHKIFAEIIYKQPKMPGPAQFDIDFKTKPLNVLQDP